MPLVRITLSESHTIETQNAISAAVHQALIDNFKIPVDDHFQIIETVKISQLRYPKNYLGISHTDDIVFIHITAIVGRSQEQKKNLYHQIATSIDATTDISKDDVIITLAENGRDNWSFGQGEMQPIKHV